jgi:predicted Zn-dependent peptidase
MVFPHTKLKNGLTVYVVPMRSTEAVTVLVLVRAGSKYETKRRSGLSHFLEHMFFKGTTNRPTSRDVAETLDRVGGEYNAFTDKERTGYYAKVDRKHLELAIDWVSDMLLNPLLKEDEIEREKGVITQEISMYYDTPTSYISDVFERLLYGDQPAGWDIAGTKEIVATFRRPDFLAYLGARYVASAAFVIVAGNVATHRTEQLVAKHFSPLRPGRAPGKPAVREAQRGPQLHLHEKETDQTHLELGLRAFDTYDKRRYALSVLATILGGNMSSRLFLTLREQHGLAYYVSTSPQHYTDTGYLSTHAGVPTKDVVRAVTIIMREYDAVRRFAVSPDELRKAKDYLKGKALIGLESSNAMAGFVGDQALLYGKAVPINEILQRVEAVSASDVRRVATTIFRENRLNLALIGPRGKERELKRALRFG